MEHINEPLEEHHALIVAPERLVRHRTLIMNTRSRLRTVGGLLSPFK